MSADSAGGGQPGSPGAVPGSLSSWPPPVGSSSTCSGAGGPTHASAETRRRGRRNRIEGPCEGLRLREETQRTQRDSSPLLTPGSQEAEGVWTRRNPARGPYTRSLAREALGPRRSEATSRSRAGSQGSESRRRPDPQEPRERPMTKRNAALPEERGVFYFSEV